ncbi:MAG: globin domain-containing protein [Rhodomicrobiaceae bacterium]
MTDIRLAQYGGYIFLVRTAMTPTQVEIVQDSFHSIGQQSQEASRIFYDELFRISPEIRQIFPEDMTQHKAKFVQMLGTVVRSLNQIATVSDHVVDLGRRHMAYDVEEEHYPVVCEALLAMLERIMGTDFTPEIKEAWNAAYDMLARVMLESSSVPNTAEGFFGTIIRSVLTSQYGVSIGVSKNVAGRAPITHGIERGQVVRFS